MSLKLLPMLGVPSLPSFFPLPGVPRWPSRASSGRASGLSGPDCGVGGDIVPPVGVLFGDAPSAPAPVTVPPRRRGSGVVVVSFLARRLFGGGASATLSAIVDSPTRLTRLVGRTTEMLANGNEPLESRSSRLSFIPSSDNRDSRGRDALNLGGRLNSWLR